MKKLKNKKRTKQPKNKHICRFEYNSELSKPDQSIFTCATQKCEKEVIEHEDCSSSGC